jgi:DnaJ homolog subfamily A member 2
LLATASITLSEALLGFDRILIHHLDGRGVRVASPRGKVITSGMTIILRNEGMPAHKNPGVCGNLYVVMQIEMPSEDWMSTADHKVDFPSLFSGRSLGVQRSFLGTRRVTTTEKG